MANEDVLKIDCTTTIVLRNTRTNKVYKDETEKKPKTSRQKEEERY